MHNLFLGTGKHMINIGNEKGLLDSGKFEQTQNSVDNLSIPCDGGLNSKKDRNWVQSFKADQQCSL